MHAALDQVPLTARRNGPLAGRVRVPGDKSISIRALILGALTVGETRISGLLEGEDVLNTAKAMQALGARMARTGERAWSIHGTGVGGFAEPAARARFRQFRHRLPPHARRGRRLPDHGDVRRRCLAAQPPDAARARSAGTDRRARRGVGRGGRLPLTLKGARDPMPIVFEPPVPSAQLKSATLLAGLSAPGETVVVEAEATRDHTEKMLTHFGAQVRVETMRQRRPPHHADRTAGTRAAACRGSRRSVFGRVSAGRGAARARVRRDPRRRDDESVAHRVCSRRFSRWAHRSSGSTCATRAARTSPICACVLGALRGVDVPAERAPSMIDEYPILAAAAAFAEGTTRMRGLKELRVKEFDRLAATADLLRVNGVDGRDRGRRSDRARQGPRFGRRHRRHPYGSSHRHVGDRSRACQRAPGADRRRHFHCNELSGIRRADARVWARICHDYCDRRAGGIGQGDDRAADRCRLRAALSRHRPALSGGGEGRCSMPAIRPTTRCGRSRPRSCSIRRSSTIMR